MGALLRMPKLGLEMEQGTVVEWYVSVDDTVEPGDLVAEIESDKAVGEVEAREGGVLRRILVDVGETVDTGTPLGVVADSDESIDDLLAGADVEASVDAGGTDEQSTTDVPADAAEAAGDESVATGEDAAIESGADGDPVGGPAASTPKPSPADQGDEVLATPRAKRLARERSHDLAAIEGSGPAGAIVGGDIERATPSGVETDSDGVEPSSSTAVVDADAATSADASDGPPVAETRSLVGVRGAVAEAMTASARNAPQVTLHRDLAVDELVDVTDSLAAQYEGSLSMIDLFLRALSAALADHPGVNGRFEAGEHRVAAVQNVGYAVATDHGLLTPVVEDVQSRSLVELADRRRKVVERVLDGSHTAVDLQDGTFTVTNLGPYDIDEFTPILNPPEVAVLGLGRVQEVPVKKTAGEVGFERRLPVSLTIDHRALDGADGAAFLQSLATYVADPRRLLLAGP
jgi:pyruvate/2-oxoglutarate dehydrogenase complex dihydrolipoamide acyltransferase (E2) component